MHEEEEVTVESPLFQPVRRHKQVQKQVERPQATLLLFLTRKFVSQILERREEKCICQEGANKRVQDD